jgi:hypothetical protein
MKKLPSPDRNPSEAAREAFGEPVFQLVEQSRVRFIGWAAEGPPEMPTILSTSHWVADDMGDFHFQDWPMGPLGIQLRGTLFTEVPGATIEPGLDHGHSALVRHLTHLVINDQINRPDFAYEFASPDWHQALQVLRDEVHALRPQVGSLNIDSETVRGLALAYGSYSATTVQIAGRVVTLVIHDEDAARIDTRIVTDLPQR